MVTLTRREMGRTLHQGCTPVTPSYLSIAGSMTYSTTLQLGWLPEQANLHPRHFRLLPRQRRRLLRDGEIVAAAPKSGSPGRRATRLSRRRRSQFCLEQAGISADRPRLRRVLRQAAAQVRADPRDLPRRRARGFGSFLMAGPALDQGKALSGPDAPRCRSAATRATLLYAEHHESHAASAFFPSPFEEAAILTHGRRRRVGHRLHRRRTRQRHRSCSRRSAGPTRSACSTRRSPTTPASRSTPANTRSWASRPTASRSTST